MVRRDECPNCGRLKTEKVDVTWYADDVEETRICNECPTQYTLSFGQPVIVDERQVGDFDG